jgi:hypothetical protein
VNARVRVSGLSGAALAALAVTLLGAPAASASTDEPGTPVVTERQVGAQVGSLPVGVTAQVAVPAWLLQPAPERLLAVPGIDGQDLLRLDATRIYAKTDTPDMGGKLGVIPKGHEVAAATTATAVDQASRPATAPRTATAPQAVADSAATAASVGEVALPVRIDDSDAQFAWVPIGGVTGAVGGSAGHALAAGLGLLAIAGGAASVVVVRRRLPAAG